METWEMIKELTENPNKKFISKIDSSRPEEKRVAYIDGRVVVFENHNGHIFINDEWEEIKQPVSFLEAMDEINYNHNKRLKVEHRPSGITTNFMFLHEILEYLSKFSNLATPEVILNGKWYIE